MSLCADIVFLHPIVSGLWLLFQDPAPIALLFLSLSVLGVRSKIKVAPLISDDAERIKQLEDEVNALKNELVKKRKVMEAMAFNFPDGLICILTKDLSFRFVKGSDIHQLKVPLRAMDNKRLSDNLHPVLTSALEGQVLRALKGEHIAEEIISENQAYLVKILPLYDVTNEINEVLILVRNITGKLKMELNLRKAMEKEKEFNVLRSRFVTLASHEFRTPLSTILTSVFLLENYKGDDYETEKGAYIDKIKRAVHNLTGLLNDFLSIGKIEEGRIKVSLGEFEIKSFIDEIIQEAMPLKKLEQQIVVTYETEQETIFSDKQLISKIIFNLLSNAIKYSSADGKIELHIELKNDLLKIVVRDNGVGIPADEKSEIFKRFFRGQNSNNIQGTGLGLNIVKKYIRLLKGNIDFVSQVNEGTTFTAKIPTSNALEK